jgi:plasmid stabilization system protein ParE
MAQTYQVIVSEEAQEEPRQIVAYVLDHAGEEAAMRVREGTLDEIAKLDRFPHAHALLQGLTAEQAVYRRILKWSYRIIFTIEESEIRVIVVRIDHARRDPASLQGLP